MKIYAAKWVVPMDGPVIEDGEVVVDDNVIVDVRRAASNQSDRIDLGNAALLPGLVNAHCHLEYTAFRGAFEDIAFFPWIRSLNAAKVHLDADDWIVSAKMGALESLAAGITTIGDNTDSGAALDAMLWSGHRGRVYQEFFCIDHRTSPDAVLEELLIKVGLLSARSGDKISIGISPHATYTINPAMFKAFHDDPRSRHLPISIHVAESPAESSLILSGTGPFAEMFTRREIVWDSPKVSPTQYVASQQILTKDTLMIHCVHQTDKDIETVAESGAAIIHCPKSNAKLGAGIAPLNAWLKQPNLRLGIGTDSAVSNNSLDLFEEMRFALLLQRAAGAFVEEITAQQVLELATVRGAEAMGLSSEIGTLTVGKRADLIAVSLDRLSSYPASDPITSIVYSATSSDVVLTVIGGRVCYEKGEFVNLDTAGLRHDAKALAEKISKVGS